MESDLIIQASFSADSQSTLSNLLENGASANTTDANTWSCLHHASQTGALDKVLMLIKYGALIDATTKDKQTPLHLAAHEGYPEVVRALLESGANVNAVDSAMESALHKAASGGHEKVADLLIKGLASLDSVSITGYTALHHASRMGHLPIVKLLIDNGADFVIYGKDSKSALDMATDAKFASVAFALTKIAAKRLRTALTLSAKLDNSVCVETEVASRELNESGGVLQSPSGAQLWFSQGALSSEHSVKMSLYRHAEALPALPADVAAGSTGPALMIETDKFDVPAVCRLPTSGQEVTVWRCEKEEWKVVDAEACVATSRFVDVTLPTLPKYLLTTSKSFSVTILAFAGTWTGDPVDLRRNGVRLIVFVIPDQEAEREAVLQNVRKDHPDLRLSGERFFPMSLKVGASISVSSPKHQPLKRSYLNAPLPFEGKVFKKESVVRVETESGFVDVMVQLAAPPLKPHTPLVESVLSDSTTVIVPAAAKSIHGGFEQTCCLEVRYLAIAEQHLIPPIASLTETTEWVVKDLGLGVRTAQLPFNYAAYVEARAVCCRDKTLASPWSRTLLVKPRGGGSVSREVETDISPTSSFGDGDTPNMSHGRFSFDMAPRIDDPEAWAERCTEAAKLSRINKRGCFLLTRRAVLVALACKRASPQSAGKLNGRVTMDDTRRRANRAAGKVIAALRNICELLVQCGDYGWLGKILELADNAESFSNADKSLVDAAVEYGVPGSAIGGLHSYSHDNVESAYGSIMLEFGLARMHLASLLFPHLESWATLEECVDSETDNLALDFQCKPKDLKYELKSDEFKVALTMDRRHKSTGHTTLATKLCQVFVSGVVSVDEETNSLMRLLQRELSQSGFRALTSENAVGSDCDQWRREAVKHCKAVVVIFTSNSEKSPSAQLEFNEAKSLRKPIVTLLHSGSLLKIPGGVPLLLRDHYDLLLSLKKIRQFLVSAGVVNLFGSSLVEKLRNATLDPVASTLNADDDSASQVSSRRESVNMTSPLSSFDVNSFVNNRTYSELSMKESPRLTLETWLSNCNLKHIAPQLRELGAYEPSDLQDLDDDDLIGLQLKPLEIKRFKRVRSEYFQSAAKRSSSKSDSTVATLNSLSSQGAIDVSHNNDHDTELTTTLDALNKSASASSMDSQLPSLALKPPQTTGKTTTPRLKPLSRNSTPRDRPKSGLQRNSHNSSSSISSSGFPSHRSSASGKGGRAKSVALLRPRAPVVVGVDATVLDVCKAMRAKVSDSAILIQGHKIAGIVTCTDITRKVAAVGKSTKEAISSIMTPNPKCVSMDDDATEALIMMMDNHFRHLPVLDRDENIIAVLDIGRCIADAIGKIDRMEAKQQEALSDAVALATSQLSTSFCSTPNQAEALQKVLGPLVDTMFRKSDLASILDDRGDLANDVINANCFVIEAVKKMSNTNRGVAVVDDDGSLAGIFTPRDLNNRVLAKKKDLSTSLVKDVMTDDPEHGLPSLSLLDALYRMHDNEVLQLTVVDPLKGVLGVVNVFDVLHATMGGDEENREGWRSFFSSALVTDSPVRTFLPNVSIRNPLTPTKSPTPRNTFRQQDSSDAKTNNGLSISVAAAAAAAVAEVASAYEEATAVRDVVRGNWKCGKAIGAGSFGHVFQGMNTLTGELIAVKFLRVPNSSNSATEAPLKPMDMANVEALAAADVAGHGGVPTPSGTDVNTKDVGVRKIRSEVELMEGLRHPNIVRYLGAELYTDSIEHRLYILQEWVPGGSLEHLVKTYGVMSSDVTSSYLRDVLEGLVFLHENQTVHRDLKPANVLVSDKGVAKLCDFGACRRLGTDSISASIDHSVEGSPYYMAPEQMRGEEGSRKADVWSVGGLVLFLVTGEHPWQCLKLRNMMALFAAVQSKDSKGPPTDGYALDAVVKSFVQRCLKNDKDERPPSEDLLFDPLLALSETKRRLSTATPRTPRPSLTPRSSNQPTAKTPRRSTEDAKSSQSKSRLALEKNQKSQKEESTSLPAVEPVNKKKARWGKVRSIITETPELLIEAKDKPEIAQDMNAFAILREDLMLAKRPFAVGGGGQIYKGTYNGCAVAVKAIFSQMNDVSGTASRQEFHQEFSMLAALHHPNIVTFYGISEDNEHGTLYIVEEFCAGGDLASHIVKQDSFDPAEYCRLVTELFGAVRYMHDKGIAHRDLKPQNVLLTELGRVKICDLGQARSFRKVAVTAAVGTAAYMPPEAFDEAITSDPSYVASHWDTYSLGVMLWQLWYREEPWGGKSTHKIYSLLMKGKRPPFMDPVPPKKLVELISQMWHQDHKKRPPMREALRMFERDCPTMTQECAAIHDSVQSSVVPLPQLVVHRINSALTPRSPHYEGFEIEDSEL